jgi:hypothetical protein
MKKSKFENQHGKLKEPDVNSSKKPKPKKTPIANKISNAKTTRQVADSKLTLKWLTKTLENK